MWDLDSNISLYTQIIDIITEKIVSGEYKEGDKLPSVRELAKEAGVNPNTMQKALSKLEETHLVKSQRTSGRFITDDKELIKSIKRKKATELTKEYIERLKNLGFTKEDILNSMKEEL